MIAQNKRTLFILLSVPLLLLIPFTAMQFTGEVNWALADFLIMGLLLLGAGLLVETVLRKVQKVEQRMILCGAILIAFLLIWAELAVGIFGTPFAGS